MCIYLYIYIYIHIYMLFLPPQSERRSSEETRDLSRGMSLCLCAASTVSSRNLNSQKRNEGLESQNRCLRLVQNALWKLRSPRVWGPIFQYVYIYIYIYMFFPDRTSENWPWAQAVRARQGSYYSIS